MRAVKIFLLKVILACGMVLNHGIAKADIDGCQDAEVISQKIFTDICWECIFPIRVMGVPIVNGDGYVPDEATRKPFCICDDNLGVPHVGITTSMWEPYRIVEFQYQPGCSSVLNGINFGFDPTFMGTHGTDEKDGSDMRFMHYHYYAFPLMIMLDLFTGKNCNAGGFLDLDLMYLSEVDPTWVNDELAFFTTPESALVANPVGVMACVADAMSANAGRPIKELFWCAGSWGTLYPFSGHTVGGNGPLHDTSLMKARVQAALHRRGLAWGTVGDDEMCSGVIKPVFPKQQYKWSMFWPVPETDSAHVIGKSSLLWGAGRWIPAVGETPIYIVWRWKDCCHTY